VFRNVDKLAINNGIFDENLQKTHSTDPNNPIPDHTVAICPMG
jgi:hypothetical protein